MTSTRRKGGSGAWFAVRSAAKQGLCHSRLDLIKFASSYWRERLGRCSDELPRQGVQVQEPDIV